MSKLLACSGAWSYDLYWCGNADSSWLCAWSLPCLIFLLAIELRHKATKYLFLFEWCAEMPPSVVSYRPSFYSLSSDLPSIGVYGPSKQSVNRSSITLTTRRPEAYPESRGSAPAILRQKQSKLCTWRYNVTKRFCVLNVCRYRFLFQKFHGILALRNYEYTTAAHLEEVQLSSIYSS